MNHTMKSSLRRACAGLGLLCAAAFLPAVAAAEEPCQLGTIGMEPQRPGFNPPQDEWAYRNVAPQRFAITLGQKNTYNPFEAEFKKIVEKEPEKYVSERPFRGVARLASKPYAFGAGQEAESSEGYDRLYFDLNGDGDLTDDKPLDAFEPPPPPKSSDAKKTDAKTTPSRALNASWSYFPRVDRAGGRRQQARLFIFFSATNMRTRIILTSWRRFRRMRTVAANFRWTGVSEASRWWTTTATAASTTCCRCAKLPDPVGRLSVQRRRVVARSRVDADPKSGAALCSLTNLHRTEAGH